MDALAPEQLTHTGARDRMRASAHVTFADNILSPIFEFNCAHYFAPLLAAHRAWLTMLAECRILDRTKAAAILQGLDAVEAAGPDCVRPFDPTVEYYYLHMERALVSRVPGGEAIVGDLNLGRTRPEPLSRMVVRAKLLHVLNLLLDLRETLLARAVSEASTVMPGYTHLQHAQPTTLGHYLLAIHDHLERDTERLLAALAATDRCTLGCGAMSGTSLPINRDRVRELLGFADLCENTIDSVSATDHVIAAAAALASVMTAIGRLCQDLYIWSSQEFAMIDVTDAFSSPSSLMPQKKNALVLEYLRSRTARTIGSLASVFVVSHNVGYMDTEEVELECYLPLFECFSNTEQSLPPIAQIVRDMVPDRELMYGRAAGGFSSVTALAELIQNTPGISYRAAHRIVARSVLLAVEEGNTADQIGAAIVNRAAEEMIGRTLSLDDEAIRSCLVPRSFVEHHAGVGATAPDEVRRMAAERQKRLGTDRGKVEARERAVRKGEVMLSEAVGEIMAP
ncbi:MAG TPA: argininosuccinate lyase [Acidobacteriaceae bacterium]|nr:argininosuccinate lyase [Acidobacteriaceae bacterium]